MNVISKIFGGESSNLYVSLFCSLDLVIYLPCDATSNIWVSPSPLGEYIKSLICPPFGNKMDVMYGMIELSICEM